MKDLSGTGGHSGKPRGPVVRIGFSYEKGFQPISWIVMKATGAPCSHCFFLLYDETLQMEIVLQAEPKGLDPTPWERFRKENNIVALWTPRHPIIEGVREVARKYLDTRYYYLGLFGMAVVELAKDLGHRIQNPFRSRKQVFCSDASTLALECSPGYAKTMKLDAGSTDPGALMAWANKNEPERMQPWSK